MSQELHPPRPVKLIVGMLSLQEEMFNLAQQRMQSLWGPIDLHSDVLPFTQTRYYEKQMGMGLLRKFVSFAERIDPGRLASIKHQSNALETELTQTQTGQSLGVERPINLDPGYVDSSKLVLVTTKNFSHRIYIGENMYAEATLHFTRGHWQSWPYTYPDYAGGEYIPFLTQVRNTLLEAM